MKSAGDNGLDEAESDNSKIKLQVKDEFGKLKVVVVGLAKSFGNTPSLENCYDARSYESVLAGVYPGENECSRQIDQFVEKLNELGVQVLRPTVLSNINQIYARDIGFVIDGYYVVSGMIEDRNEEQDAALDILKAIDKTCILHVPNGAYVEGGDVIVHNEYVFVGVSSDHVFQTFKTARTNSKGIDFLIGQFPKREFKGFELKKDDRDAKKGALHLDCAFQPIGCGAIIAPHLFKSEHDVEWLLDYFGKDNCYLCSLEEAYDLGTNVFSVAPNQVIVPDTLLLLQDWIRSKGLTVHPVKYDEIVKMGGLFRCTTLPLIREYD